MDGRLHQYAPRLTLFEHLAPATLDDRHCQGIVLWVGGLSDGLCTVDHVPLLAAHVHRETRGQFTLAQVLLSSSYDGWGTGSIARDAQELAHALTYVRDVLGRQSVVVIGHSTGCQDIVALYHLAEKHGWALPDAAILQAPVSDREYLQEKLPKLEETLELPAGCTDPHECFVPSSVSCAFGPTRVTHARWRSLAARPSSPTVDVSRSEDFFSSDLDAAYVRDVFRPVPARAPRGTLTLVLGDQDETYPCSLRSKSALARLLRSFTDAADHGGSAQGGKRHVVSAHSTVLSHASHDLADERAQKQFFKIVQDVIADLRAQGSASAQ